MLSPKNNRPQTKPVARKRRRSRSQQKKSRISVVRLIIALSLLGFFLFTVGAVGYVIFFRTVLA